MGTKVDEYTEQEQEQEMINNKMLWQFFTTDIENQESDAARNPGGIVKRMKDKNQKRRQGHIYVRNNYLRSGKILGQKDQ